MTHKLPIELSMRVNAYSAEDPGGWSKMFDAAIACDKAGVDRLVVSDHVVFGEALEEYGRPELGGLAGGKQPTGPDGHWLEPLTALSFIAAKTSRVRLGTNIIIAGLRRPVTFAKTASTLDVLSEGRLDLGVGVGWQREEFEAAGLPYESRGKLLDRTLEVCQVLWRERRASYSSPDLNFEHIHMMPKPLQEGGVPIWVGGSFRNTTVRRIVQFGSGWIPWGDDAADLTTSVPRMKEAVEKAGGDGSKLQVVGYLPMVKQANGDMDIERTMAGVPALAEIGVTDFRSAILATFQPEHYEERLGEIVTAFRAAVGR